MLDNLTFYSMLSVLQGGLWLLNDLEEFLKKYNLSHGRFSILLAVMESSESSMIPAEMALMLGKSKPTISKMVKKLEEDHFLCITKDGKDKRIKRLSITGKAEELLNTVIPDYNKRIIEMSSGLSDTDKSQIMKIISKINFLNSERRITVKE